MGKVDSQRTSQSSVAVELNALYFDPNDSRYRCFCQQCHATTGMKIIAGLLCVTVILEVWQMALYCMSNEFAPNNILVSSLFQLLVGSCITGSVLYALKSENAAFLSPYLLLQTVGLAAGFVIFFALLYITLANDVNTIKTFIESHGPRVNEEKYLSRFDKNSLVILMSVYVGWTMVGSCVAVLGLQFWLISIVFSCWRYYRDKKEFGYSKGTTSSLVVLRPLSTATEHDNFYTECDGYTALCDSLEHLP